MTARGSHGVGLLVALVALALAVAAAPAWGASGDTHAKPQKPNASLPGPVRNGNGIVQAVRPHALVVRLLDGRTLVVPVPPRAVVLVNGARSPLAAVQPGFVVAITARGGKAVEIRASGGAPAAPKPGTVQSVSGNAVVGQQLTATTGTWQGSSPINFNITWQHCNSAVTSCSGTGKKGNSYTVAAADVGKRMRVRVEAQNSVGKSSALSDTTAVVANSSGGGGGGGNTVKVADVGPAGERLTVDKVVFNPNPVTNRSVPIRVTITVKDTKGRLVQGALVFFRSTPIVTSTPTDAPTGSDGTVTYNIQPRSDFPIKNGFSVQFFAKAYRQGDPTLSGISGTRLVQVATHKP